MRTIFLFALTVLLASCAREEQVGAPDAPPRPEPRETTAGVEGVQDPPVTVAEFVGGRQCATCHVEALAAWRGSHHDLAMAEPTPETVRGDFDGVTFEHLGQSFHFTRDADLYLVRTPGPDGVTRDFEVAYTFGWEPLQQYLIRFPDGRLQALSACWDTRPASEGGQRWFHLYPDEPIPSTDPLHWTKPAHNWNHACAECHSTNLRKNYDPETDRFSTRWTDIDVSCEACHGPGSAHVDWARGNTGLPHRGLVNVLARSGDWFYDPGARTAHREPPLPSRAEAETCARCHSRRSTMVEAPATGGSLLDTHRLAFLDEGLYFADGQIDDEVYVHGSFLQSKMHAAGVTCTDCHDAHSTRLRAEGNALCTKCHQASAFDTPAHHHHRHGSKGASCVECHMPTRTYMVVDARRDHSFRVPRPELAARVGAPDACTSCHQDRSQEWAAAAIAQWFPKDDPATPPRVSAAEALHAAREGRPGSRERLLQLLEDRDAPAIFRATAATLLPPTLLAEAAKDPSPLVRAGVARALAAGGEQARALALQLVDDPVRDVRTEAARTLASAPRLPIPRTERSAHESALAEWHAEQELHRDRAESLTNLGNLARDRGDLAEAEAWFRKARTRNPQWLPGTINLVDTLRELGREEDSEGLLRETMQLVPGHGDLLHTLGLTLVRQGRHAEALPLLGAAQRARPEIARYAYVHGVALRDQRDPASALQAIEGGIEHHPYDPDLRLFAAELCLELGRRSHAKTHVGVLQELGDRRPLVLDLARELGLGD